jgi:hypothetical protein
MFPSSGEQFRKLLSIRVPVRETFVLVQAGNEIAFMPLKIFG